MFLLSKEKRINQKEKSEKKKKYNFHEIPNTKKRKEYTYTYKLSMILNNIQEFVPLASPHVSCI
jgi:hypothetical protein